MYNLLVDGSVRSKYALTSFRRNQLLRLRGFLNEATVDQVSLAPARSPASPRPSPTPNPPSVDQVPLALTLALTLALALGPELAHCFLHKPNPSPTPNRRRCASAARRRSLSRR